VSARLVARFCSCAPVTSTLAGMQLYCPSCSKPVAEDAASCDSCSAVFHAPGGWSPATSPSSNPPKVGVARGCASTLLIVFGFFCVAISLSWRAPLWIAIASLAVALGIVNLHTDQKSAHIATVIIGGAAMVFALFFGYGLLIVLTGATWAR
jgi:hypothetical protein